MSGDLGARPEVCGVGGAQAHCFLNRPPWANMDYCRNVLPPSFLLTARAEDDSPTVTRSSSALFPLLSTARIESC